MKDLLDKITICCSKGESCFYHPNGYPRCIKSITSQNLISETNSYFDIFA